MEIQKLLSLNPARSVATHQVLDICDANPVEVTNDGVFQAARRHREFQGILFTLKGIQSIDQPSSERVPASNAIDDIRDHVTFAEVEMVTIVQTS